MKSNRFYCECSLLVSTETWLNNSVRDSCVDLNGFTLIKADRDASSGRTCVCKRPMVLSILQLEKICCQDAKHLVLGLRPYYVPREFSHVVVVTVYIHQTLPVKSAELFPGYRSSISMPSSSYQISIIVMLSVTVSEKRLQTIKKLIEWAGSNKGSFLLRQ